MYQIYSDYANFRWINYNRWSESQEVDELVAHLLKGIEGRKVSGYRINMKIIVLDLYQSFLADPEQWIAYHRGKDHYLKAGKGNKYINNPHVTHAYFVGSIDQLIKNEYIENKDGGQFYNQELGELFSFVSRMRPTEKLADLWDEYKINPDMIIKFKDDDLIKLRGPEKEETYIHKGKTKTRTVKPPMDCPVNRVTRRMKTIIQEYNNLLERSRIDVDVECLSQKDRDALVKNMTDMQMKDKRIILRLADKAVYRVFNNGSLEEGGRYYGAWWIGAPSIVRKYITINGNPTVDLDYSGIHVHLLYALKGINYADLNEDAYTLDDGLPDRKLNKLILLTAFNAKNSFDTASAVFDDMRKKGKLTYYGLTEFDQIYTKLELLKKKHKPIQGEIANDYGRKLQYFDSCVIEKLIKHYTKKDIPILTVHDSVICEVQHAELVRDKMWKLYRDTIDDLLNFQIHYMPHYSYSGKVLRLLNDFKKYYKGIKPRRLLSTILGNKPYTIYQDNIQVIKNRIINIKQDQRSNKCNKQCNHFKRISSNRICYKSLKLELIANGESYTNILVIR
jgi:hypothetical protein